MGWLLRVLVATNLIEHMRINYTITGSLEIGEYYREDISGWDSMTNEQRLEIVKQAELEDNGAESIIDDVCQGGKIEITSVE